MLLREAVRALDDPMWQRYPLVVKPWCRATGASLFVSRIDVDTLILQRPAHPLVVIGLQLLAGGRAAGRRARGRRSGPIRCSPRCIASTPGLHRLLAADLLHRHLFILFFRFTWAGCPSSTGPTSTERDRLALVVGALPQSIMPVTVLGLFQAASWMRRALGGAGRDPPGPRHDGARKGLPGALGRHPARGAQCADPGRDAGRAADAGGLRRRHRHRADLPRSRHRLAADQRHPGATTRR